MYISIFRAKTHPYDRSKNEYFNKISMLKKIF